MRELLESLARRRQALIARSAREREALVATAGSARRAASERLVLGLGVAVALAGASPRLRTWFVRAWVAAAFVRRVLSR